MNFKANGRLAEIASRVALGSVVLDVGCDHGYIPIYLAENDIASRVFASDISRGPLETAKKNAAKRGFSDKITFYLADGIPEAAAPLVDTVIIAGMGGETIAGILNGTPKTLKAGVFFILQPQTKQGELLEYLRANGFGDITLSEVVEGRRKYTIITAKFPYERNNADAYG